MTKVAICLLTCDRETYTQRTLSSLAQHNDLSAFTLLHADDASTSARNTNLARSYGFRTVVQHDMRLGWRATRPALFMEAAKRRVHWVLFLENDIESLRPFPWELFSFVAKQSDIYCLRLYGRFKDRAKTDACLTTHKRRSHEPVQWKPLRNAPEMSQVGDIHWSAQPCVTRIGPLLSLHLTGHEPQGFTARVKKNVMAHFGVERTTPRERPAVESAPAEASW